MTKAMQLRSKIKNLALKNKIPAQAVLQNFMLERLLERITVSKYRDIFILKGGMLIASIIGCVSISPARQWSEKTFRRTSTYAADLRPMTRAALQKRGLV
jgi:hypothetical protein